MNDLFCDLALAARIERAEAQFIAAATEAAGRRGAVGLVRRFGGGFACIADEGSPMNKVVGLGFGGVPDAAELDEAERMCAEFGTPAQVELSTLADPDIAPLLCDRGYRLVGFENVLGRALPGTPLPLRSAVEVRRARHDEIDAWVAVVVDGFAHPDGEGVPTHEDFPRDVIERAERDVADAGVRTYVALCDGVIAGGGGVRFADGVAQLAGAATAPAYRRRGVQSALLATRLSDAADAGCDVAVVTTAPGSMSQKNVQRSGFALLYSRAVLVKAVR